MTTQIPNMLRIIDGELVCSDGSCVKEYLRSYASKNGITKDTPVVLLQRSGYGMLLDAYYMLSHWAA